MSNKHLSHDELIMIAGVKTKHNIATKKSNKIVADKINKVTEENPEMTESEVDEYMRELLEHEASKLAFSDDENRLLSHIYNCFHCENKLNKMMGIDEELILQEEDFI